MNHAQLYRGIEEINQQYFFEAHDTLEDLWHETRGNDRKFVQGLIQVSVGFYHLLNRNYRGSASQFSKGLEKLHEYFPEHQGVALEEFCKEVKKYREIAEQGVRGEIVTVEEKDIPKLKILNHHL